MENNNTNHKLEQALYLAEKLGWSIIPVGINKRPTIDWKPYQTQSASNEQIKDWFTNNPNLNIGVVTGKISNLVVVDIDPRHDGTEDELKDIKTVKSATGGGGWHYYFQYEEGINNKAGIKPGIDVRGEAGYVIVPPSSHQSGKSYEWVNSPSECEILKLPDFVKGWIGKPRLFKVTDNSGVDNLLNGVSEGSRNQAATQVLGSWLKRFDQGEWKSKVWPLLTAWNLKNNPPLSEAELKSIFESICTREVQSIGGTETPDGIKKELISNPLNYQEVESKVLRLLPNSQTALKLILAVAVSTQYQNPVMLWLLLVGVPSSGKTDLVRLIKDSDVTYYLDNLTQNAFISGERSSKSNRVHDLLPLLDKKCLVIKDWTSIFSLDEKMTKKLLGDLVGIYDKEFTKFSSRRGNISYSSAFAQLGCITPATLNRHTNYMNMVGPRFLCYTMPSATHDSEDLSYAIIFSSTDRSLIDKEARLFASSYVNQLVQKTPEIKPLDEKIQQYLRLAAKLMSNCRGIVLLQSATFKNEEGEDVKYYEVQDVQIEEPWRAIQQLISLAKYLSFVVGKNEVGTDELAIVKEVVISSMPAERSQALRMIKEHGGEVTAKELSDLSEKSTKTSRRLLDELVALKALEKIKGSGNLASDYKITSQFRDFILLDPAEFLSAYSCGTETLDSMPITSEINSIPGLEGYK